MAFVLGFSKLGSCVIMKTEEEEDHTIDLFASFEEPYDSQQELAAELRLFAAVINRAIADATGMTSLVPFANIKTSKRDRKDTIDAKGWILDDDMQPFSFLWLAEALELTDRQIDIIRGRVCKDD